MGVTVKDGQIASDSPVYIDVSKGLNFTSKLGIRTSEYVHVDSSTSRVLQM